MTTQRWRTTHLRPVDPRTEWLLAIAVTVVSVVAVAIWGRDLWHRADAFDFLMRRDFSIDSLLTPHKGHLQTPTVLLYLVLYPLFGIDAPLAYAAPRLIGFAVLSLVTWRAVLWRGADRGVAFAVLCVTLFLGVSDFLYASVFGVFIVIPGLVVVGWLLETRRDGPSGRDQVIMAAVLTVLVISTSSGVAVLGGTVLVIASTRPLRRWWPALVAPLVVYGTWYLTYGRGQSAGGFSLGALLSVPYEGAVLLGGTLASLTGLPTAFGPVLVLTLVATGFWLISRGGFSVFDALYLTTLVIFMALIVVFRVEAQNIAVTFNRYALVPSLLLITVFVPKIRIPSLPVRYLALATIIGVALPGNIVLLVDGLDSWEHRTRNVYEEVATVAALIEQGEPALPEATLNRSLTGILEITDVERMEGPNWPPPLTEDPGLLSDARAAMRMQIIAGEHATAGTPLVTDQEVHGGCLNLEAGKSIRFSVIDTGAISLATEGGETTLRVMWTDLFGTAVERVTISGHRNIAYARPDGPTELAIRNTGSEDVQICGVERG